MSGWTRPFSGEIISNVMFTLTFMFLPNPLVLGIQTNWVFISRKVSIKLVEKNRLMVSHCFGGWNLNIVCSETVDEYTRTSREVVGELLKGICGSLGIEENYIHKRLKVELGTQLLIANLYPPCPKPELTMGLPAHTDHGLLTLLLQNHLGGLQIQHKGKWIPVNPLPNSFLVNTGDHLEVKQNSQLRYSKYNYNHLL